MQKTLVIFFSIIAVSSSYIVDYGPVVKATKGKYFSKKNYALMVHLLVIDVTQTMQ